MLLYKVSDSSKLSWFIITDDASICQSKISTSIWDCIRTINNPNGYNRDKHITVVYSGEKTILCTFNNPDELITLVPEEFL